MKTKAVEFDETLRRYQVLLRWSSFREALSFHAKETGSIPAVDPNNLSKNIKVTALKTINKELDVANGTGKIQFTISYYRQDTGVIHTESITQQWWYSSDTKHWFIESDFPTFSS